MESYAYPYAPSFPTMRPPDGMYPDHGDGFGEYYGLGPLNETLEQRPSRSKQRTRKNKATKRSRTRSANETKSRSHSRSRSHSSGTHTVSRTRSRTRSRSRSGTRRRDISFKEPSILDAFRVLYLIPSKHKNNTSKYLATKKRQDRVQELLKSDGLGSKRWLFYPRSHATDQEGREVAGSRDNCDRRVKVDADFFRKYKRSKKVDTDAPITKLKRWELLLYKKLGFIQAV